MKNRKYQLKLANDNSSWGRIWVDWETAIVGITKIRQIYSRNKYPPDEQIYIQIYHQMKIYFSLPLPRMKMKDLITS